MIRSGLALRCALAVAMVVGLSRSAFAQSIGSSEAEIVRVFDKLGYRANSTWTRDDGTPARNYAHSSRKRYVVIVGDSVAPISATIAVPYAELGTVGDAYAFTQLICAHDKCDPLRVQEWIGQSGGRTLAEGSRRFGAIDFHYVVGNETIPIWLLDVDARPAFREAAVELARAAEEERAREVIEEHQRALREDLDHAIDALAMTASADEVEDLRRRIASASDLDSSAAPLMAKFSIRAFAIYVRKAKRAIVAGDYATASLMIPLAERSSAVLNDPSRTEQARNLHGRLLIQLAVVAETATSWRDARRFYVEASRFGVADETRAALARIDSHMISPGVAQVLSILPGTGQLYSRRYVPGALFLGGTVLAAVGGSLAFVAANNEYANYKSASVVSDIDAHYRNTQILATTSLVALGVVGVLCLWSFFDAPAGARKWNHEHFE